MKKTLKHFGFLLCGVCLFSGLVGCEKNQSSKVEMTISHSLLGMGNVIGKICPVMEESEDEYYLTMKNYRVSVKKSDWEKKKDELTGSQSADELLMNAVQMLIDVDSYENKTQDEMKEIILLDKDSDEDDWGKVLIESVLGTSSNLTLQEGIALCALQNMGISNSVSYEEDIHKLCANYCLSADLTLSHIGVYENECNYNIFPGTKWKYRVMSASFCRYLSDTYGQDVLMDLYKSEDDAYEKHTNKNLSTLKEEWIASLSNYKSMSEDDLQNLRSQWYGSRELDNPYDVEPVKVACVGDSITYGTLLDNRDATNYPLVMDALLGNGFTVGNFGNPGSTLMNSADEPYRYSWECEASKEYNGDIVVMMLGTNDTKGINWKGIDAYAESFEAAIKEYESLSSNPKIYLCTPCAGLAATYDIRPDRIKEIAEFVKDYGAKNGYPVIDMYSMTEDNWDLFVWDGIHPNVAGARMMAEKVAQALVTEEETEE